MESKFSPGEKVTVSRLGDDIVYQATVVGRYGFDIYIVEIDYPNKEGWTHRVFVESVIDKIS